MISANRIEFRGYSSVDFDLKTCMAFESDSGEVSTYLTREAVASESYRGEYKRIHNFKYTETFNPKFTFIKDGFRDFEVDEVRKVLRWLTSSHNASFLTVYKDDSNVVHFEILGGFSEASLHKLGNGRVVAITATFESAYPYALSPLKTITKDVSDPSNNTITINIDTDEPEIAVYPRITIKQKDSVIVDVNHEMITNKKWGDDEDWIDGTVYKYVNDDGDTWYYYQKHDTTTDDKGNTINISEPTATQTNPTKNNTKTSVVIKNIYADQNGKTQVVKLRITNNVRNEVVILDGANKIVSSWSLNDDDILTQNTARIFGDDFVDWAWLPLYDGINTIEVIGNCEVTFEYREPRKIGEF